MQNSILQAWINSSYLASENIAWIEQLYKEFLINPNTVHTNWRLIFQQLSDAETIMHDILPIIGYNNSYFLSQDIAYNSPSILDHNNYVKQIKIVQLINAYRFFGYKNANLDPLGLWKQEYIIDLDPKYYNLTELDYQTKFDVNELACSQNIMTLEELIIMLKKTYCHSVGVEYMHISSAEEKHWIQHRIESIKGFIKFSVEEKKRFLSELIAAEGFERYIGTKFPGSKRFSLEGGDVLIPMLKEIIRYAGNNDIREIIIGMAHRGRLNVLINIMGKRPKDLFNEFNNTYKKYYGTGDVKYHMGFSSKIKTNGGSVHLELAFNPSHLEIINPVIMGSVRARIDHFYKSVGNKLLPITIHGDAAIIGQGVVQETLHMSQVQGYEVGGTIRIIINNQIGFTTDNQLNLHSILYCTNVGKIIQAPIFHVNADDLEAVIFVTRLALDFRNIFKRDVFIDLVCYRRHGHNESDEPSITQPLMYKKIRKHPTLSKIYANKLIKEEIIHLENINDMINLYQDMLDIGECVVKNCHSVNTRSYSYLSNYHQNWNLGNCDKININRLQELAICISTVPKTIVMQSRVAKIYDDRKQMALGKKLIDWGCAENLAYATLLDQGISVRLSGEDSSRGAFFHRHAIIHNQSNGSTYIPIQHIHNHQGQFNVWDSILSEEAVLAFEYGYAITETNTLTIWEAQFGDFANGAQVVIDQFISSGEQKWGQMCGLVMLLPHGYEGYGPEHSSARLERYLQLCAEHNIQVCIPSTPAQIYHMLRRQALCDIRRPLIVMSPKSLLHHPLVMSSLEDLANNIFLPIIDEIDHLDPEAIRRIILCSGKIYYDLVQQRRKNNQKNIAIIRIEQFYPFPYLAIQEIIKPYSHIHDYIWCQEEPLNQGAWHYIQHYLRKVIPFNLTLNYIGRPSSAAPAVGSISIHQKQQKDIINNALSIFN